MVDMETYGAGLDALVAEQVRVISQTTAAERFEAHFYASNGTLTRADLAGMLAVATERLAQASL